MEGKRIMKKMLSHLPALTLLAIACVMLDSNFALAQSREKVIEWPKNPFGWSTDDSPDIRWSPVEDALEITDVSVDGKSVVIGQSFVASREWIKSLKVRVKNISSQPAVSIRMGFYLPEIPPTSGGGLVFQLRYGTYPIRDQTSEVETVVQPGQEADLILLPEDYQRLKESIEGRDGFRSVSKLHVSISSVVFTDGSHWVKICLPASQPGNACPRRAA